MPDTLSHRTIKNSIFSLIGFILPLLLSFVATPIVIRSLGSAKFGFYSLLNNLPLVFALLDFGLSYTLVKRLSENRLEQTDKDLSEIFSSTGILYAILGTVVMVLLLLLQGVFNQLFKIPTGFISSYKLAFLIIGATFLVKMLAVPLTQIPYSLQRQDILTYINIINYGSLQVGSIIAIKTGHGVLSLLLVQLIAAFLSLLSYYISWKFLAPDLKFVPVLSARTTKTIGQQGFWVFIRNNMGNILAYLDKFVLGAIWGPVAVGYYSAAQTIPEKISSTSLSVSQVFFPVFSEVSFQEGAGRQRVKAIFRRSLGVISIITSGLTILVILFGYQLIRYWISKDFADHTTVAVPLLAVTFFLLAFNNFFQAFLSGLKELKFLAVSILIVAIVDVIFMFVLIPPYSVNGASLAYLLSGLPIALFLYYIERKYFDSKRNEIVEFYGKLFAKIALVGMLTFILGWFGARPFIHNLSAAVVLGGATFAAYLALFWCFGFYSADDVALARVYLSRFNPVKK